MSNISHKQSDRAPVTIRTLVETAVRNGWSFNTPIASLDHSSNALLIAHEVCASYTTACPGVVFLDIHTAHEDEWEVGDSSADEELAQLIAKRVLHDMGDGSGRS